MAVAMQVTLEAQTVSTFITDRIPCLTAVVDIRAQEEFQVLASLYIFLIQRLMILEGTAGNQTCIIISGISCEHTQVVEVPQLIETILCSAVVVDINLTVALQTGRVVIHIQVVLLIVHDVLQVVVVGHGHRHIVRIALTQIGLGVVSKHVAVLIPVERIDSRNVFPAVGMAYSITLFLEQLPSAS